MFKCIHSILNGKFCNNLLCHSATTQTTFFILFYSLSPFTVSQNMITVLLLQCDLTTQVISIQYAVQENDHLFKVT